MTERPVPWLDACGARAAMARGQVLPSELLADCLARIARHNLRLNALVTLDAAAAQALARIQDEVLWADGLPPDQPLFGIPFSVKDAFATAGLRTTASHPPLADHVPGQDATLVARLKGAGGLLLGKSNLSQLAGDPQCWSPVFGPTRNPWDPALTPGGSSGGAAVAVAMGFSLVELGSDIGGSIRIPAAYCGVVGFKATENRLPRTGHIPHLPGTPRSVRHGLSFGVLARSVADVAHCLPILAGPDGADGEVAPVPWRPGEPAPAAETRPLRGAWWDELPAGGGAGPVQPLCPRTQAALESAVARLTGAGHWLTRGWPGEVEIPDCWQTYGTVIGAEIGQGMARAERWALGLAGPLLPRHAPLTRAFAAGVGADFACYSRALARREQLMFALDRFLQDYDFLLCPVAAVTAYPAFPLRKGRPLPELSVGNARVLYLEAALGWTTPFSLTGHPVLTLPVGVFDGLPVGLQVVGRRFGDEVLLAVGQRLQALFGVPCPGDGEGG